MSADGRAGAVLVTGASRGIGAEIARRLGKRRVPVCINHSNSDADAEAVAAGIIADGGEAIAVKADLADPLAVEGLFSLVDSRLGGLQGLVNNAAYAGRSGRRVDQCDSAVLAQTFGINVIAPFICAREALRRMSTRHGGQGGRIVNISSTAARTSGANDWVDYAASKAALDTFTLGLAREVAMESVRVNGVAPGLIETGIHERSGDPQRLARIATAVPAGRPGQPVEVAEVVVWLLLDAPDYVHGTTVVVSGGM